jgi:hypothetical protein
MRFVIEKLSTELSAAVKEDRADLEKIHIEGVIVKVVKDRFRPSACQGKVWAGAKK